MFIIKPTKAYKLTNKKLYSKHGCVPVVSNSSENNGIGGYVGWPATENGGIVTFSDTTDAKTIFYQPESFVGYPHVQGMYAKDSIWSRQSLLYFAAVFKARAIQYKFDYATKFTRIIVANMGVTLPVDGNGRIDFDYMEAYIRELENARVRELDNYLKAAGLNDCELSRQEKLAVESCQSGKMKTGEFAVGDLFVVNSNPQLNKESFEFTGTSEYPYFTRTVFNNGILGNVDYLDEVHKINGGSLAVGMLGMQFFYMEHDFYAGQFTKTVFLKDGGRLDEKLALWFASLFNKAKGHFMKGLVRDFERLFLSLKILLPVKPNGKPDFDTMRDLISGVMKLSIRRVVEWKDSEIAATKKTFSSASDSMSTVVVPADGFIGMNSEEYLEAAGLHSGEGSDEYVMPPEEPFA